MIAIYALAIWGAIGVAGLIVEGVKAIQAREATTKEKPDA